jgi:hypothetical protein
MPGRLEPKQCLAWATMSSQPTFLWNSGEGRLPRIERPAAKNMRRARKERNIKRHQEAEGPLQSEQE